jgi:uncharacterized protein YjbI with pentapeptide repeats
MANFGHQAKLREGVTAWNSWRADEPSTVPDLAGADLLAAVLIGADLRQAKLLRANLAEAVLTDAILVGAALDGANLHRTHFYRANLSSASLRRADLTNADLHEANLTGANLIGANLSGADATDASFPYADLTSSHLANATFIRANLGFAKLCKSDLQFAELEGANLQNSDITDAQVGFTVFGNNDLRTIVGLETVRHSGPSTIGIDTIYSSKGKVPELFLHRAGVPTEFVTYMRSLTADPIEFYSCFISYSSKNQEFAQELHTKLQAHEVRCWYAPEDLKIGDKFQERIEESIKLYDKLLVVLSGESVNSPWVEREVQAAFEKEQRQSSVALFPVTLDDAVMDCQKAWAADIRRTRHIGDFRRWKDHDSFQESLDRLLRDLKSQDPERR